MKLRTKGRHIPARLATGAFLLNSGIEKAQADQETAESLHEMASGTYPFLGKLEPSQFRRLLSTTEIALGAALLIPVVPTVVAGAGLAAFSAGLLGLYLTTPGLRQEGSLRPSRQGITVAKDVWLFGIAAGFLVDELVSGKDQPPVRTVLIYDASEDEPDVPAVLREAGEPSRNRFVIVSGPEA